MFLRSFLTLFSLLGLCLTNIFATPLVEITEQKTSSLPASASSEPTPTIPPPIKTAAEETTNLTSPNAPKNPPVYKILSENDSLGRPIRIDFLDKDNKPSTTGQLPLPMEKKLHKAQGYASIKAYYADNDPNAKPIRIEFFDLKGEPVLTSEGFAKVLFQYNSSGEETKRTFLDLGDQPVTIKQGYATMTRQYNSLHRLIKEKFTNAEGSPSVNTINGYATLTVTPINNDKEYMEITNFTDSQGNAIKVDGAYKHATGISKKFNLIIKKSFHNIDDSLMNSKDGYAISFERDKDNVINPKEAYLDELCNFVNGPEGFAQLFCSKDPDTDSFKEIYLDDERKPVMNKKLNWCYKTYTLDSSGKQKKVEYFDINDKRVIPVISGE